MFNNLDVKAKLWRIHLCFIEFIDLLYIIFKKIYLESFIYLKKWHQKDKIRKFYCTDFNVASISKVDCYFEILAFKSKKKYSSKYLIRLSYL